MNFQKKIRHYAYILEFQVVMPYVMSMAVCAILVYTQIMEIIPAWKALRKAYKFLLTI